jgi:hypothetical protein
MTLQEIFDKYGSMAQIYFKGEYLYGQLVAIDASGKAYIQRPDKDIIWWGADADTWEVHAKPTTVTYLKPLHVILTEDPSYEWEWDTTREQYRFVFADGTELYEDLIGYLGKPLAKVDDRYHPEYLPRKWTHEVTER